MRPLPRSLEAEWMDRRDNPAAEVERALRDLAHVNRFLGGASSVVRVADRFLAETPVGAALEVLDVGAGGGDVAAALVRRGRLRGREVRVVAVDRDQSAGAYARRTLREPDAVRVVCADAFSLPFRRGSFDLVTASLFLHHFPHSEVVRLLRGFLAIARRAVVVSDLRRHRFPWAFIAVAARVTGRGAMFVHDAPLSVRRGFTDDELRAAAIEAGCVSPLLERRFPFRLVLVAAAAGDAP